MLADNVGALFNGAPTVSAPILSHSAPMSSRYICDGTTTSSDSNIWTYNGYRAAPLYATTFTCPRAHVVGKLSRAVLSTGISDVVAPRISDEWLPDIFQKTKVTHKLF